jgi:hypothetical protein
MIRRSMVLWMILALLFGVAMFLIKQEVQIREARLDALHRDILGNQESIQVLRAEWSYLNQPVRIESLIRRYMDLRPTDTSQLGGYEALPVRLTEATTNPEVGR